jgi:hypothetical protein
VDVDARLWVRVFYLLLLALPFAALALLSLLVFLGVLAVNGAAVAWGPPAASLSPRP